MAGTAGFTHSRHFLLLMNFANFACRYASFAPTPAPRRAAREAKVRETEPEGEMMMTKRPTDEATDDIERPARQQAPEVAE
jgi:hypothetical protein